MRGRIARKAHPAAHSPPPAVWQVRAAQLPASWMPGSNARPSCPADSWLPNRRVPPSCPPAAHSLLADLHGVQRLKQGGPVIPVAQLAVCSLLDVAAVQGADGDVLRRSRRAGGWAAAAAAAGCGCCCSPRSGPAGGPAHPAAARPGPAEGGALARDSCPPSCWTPAGWVAGCRPALPPPAGPSSGCSRRT